MDYFNQVVTIQTSEGPTDIAIPDIDAYYTYNIQASIDWGAQIGATIVLLVAVLLLSKPDKRRSSIFIINAVTLVLNLIRTVTHVIFFTSSFSEFYAYFAGDYSRVPRDVYATQINASVFETLVLIAVEISLCLQVKVVCVTLRDAYQRIILGFSALVALLAVAFRFVYMIENCIYIMRTQEESSLYWIGSATNITTTVSICWYALIFSTKLGFAIRQRGKLGMGGFGPMQIIFIMGTQTLIIPGKQNQDLDTGVPLIPLQRCSPSSNTWETRPSSTRTS